MPREPGQVHRLAAQRHEDPAARRQREFGEVAPQVAIDFALVETDAIVLPAIEPVLMVYHAAPHVTREP